MRNFILCRVTYKEIKSHGTYVFKCRIQSKSLLGILLLCGEKNEDLFFRVVNV